MQGDARWKGISGEHYHHHDHSFFYLCQDLNIHFFLSIFFKIVIPLSNQGSKLFRAKPLDHVLGGKFFQFHMINILASPFTIYGLGNSLLSAGDFENNDGTGGSSAFADKYLLAEQCPLKVIPN